MDQNRTVQLDLTSRQLALVSEALKTEVETTQNAIQACDDEDEYKDAWIAEVSELRVIAALVASALAMTDR
jgi:hypothetical protein